MEFLSHLNPEQRTAVLHTDGPLLILAGAGSGKTRVIAYRIAYLIGSGFAEPGEVLAVTFTNKAADEMRERVERLLGAECSGAWLSTFHALCARLLRREAPALGLSRDFVIYDTADQVAAVRQAVRQLGLDEKLVQPRLVLGRISAAKNRLERPDEVRAAGWSYHDEQTARVYERYQQILADSQALDFDDLLLKAVELFDRHDDVRARYAERFRYVMVDEYQDTNRPQYLLVRWLAGRHRNLCVVGDPDQSIYKWRGADLRNILDFEHDFPETTIVRLERNYRSTQVILDAATAVIRRNRDRQDKRLWTDQTGGAPIVYYGAADEIDEAEYIARSLARALADEGDGPLAVLYRTNAQSRVIEDALRRQGVAYKIIGGVRFYERKEIKDALAYLRLILNPHDDLSFRRVINVPARGIGKAVIDALQRLPHVDGESPSRSLWARLVRATDERLLPPRATAALAAFRELLAALVDIARHDPVSVAIGKVLDRTGYLRALREDGSEEANARVENLAELVSAAREYELRETDPSLQGFADRLALLSDADEEAGAEHARIWLMTMHAAKGLEFPVVVVSGLDEGLFPHARSSEEQADLEEERRLCYVAMTRARARLLLTSAARRRVFGEYQASQPSRFVSEIPAELIEMEASYAPRRESWSGARQTALTRQTTLKRRDAPPGYTYEDEDQAAPSLRPGLRVRHPQFGVGTVVTVEPLEDDVKLTVRFAAVGQKKLMARYANLRLA